MLLFGFFLYPDLCLNSFSIIFAFFCQNPDRKFIFPPEKCSLLQTAKMNGLKIFIRQNS